MTELTKRTTEPQGGSPLLVVRQGAKTMKAIKAVKTAGGASRR